MDVCTLCEGSYKNLGSHVRQAHNMSMEEYRLMNSADTELTDELSEHLESSIAITNKEKENIILDIPQTLTEDMTVGQLLIAKELTLKDLGAIISQFRSGKRLDITQSVKRNEIRGTKEAKRLSVSDRATTEDLWTAEALCVQFGFEVDQVTRNPKTWWLSKAA